MGSRRAVPVAALPGVQPGDLAGLGGLALAQCGRSAVVREARTSGAVWAGSRYPLAHHGGRILALTIAGVVLVLGPGILAMCLIWQRLRTTAPPDGANWPAAGKQAGELLRARERLAQVLLALGLAVGAVTLATGALRSAVLAYLPQEASHYPGPCPLAVWRGRNRRAGGRLLSSIFLSPGRVAASRRRHISTGPDRPPRPKLVCGPREFHRAAEAGNRPSGVLPDRCRDPRPAARQPARHSPANKMKQSPPCHRCSSALEPIMAILCSLRVREPELERKRILGRRVLIN